MTKSELIEQFAERTNMPKQRAALLVGEVFQTITEALSRGERVELRNFGNFSVRRYRGYWGRNPKSGEQVKVEEKALPYFKVSDALRQRLNRHENV